MAAEPPTPAQMRDAIEGIAARVGEAEDKLTATEAELAATKNDNAVLKGRLEAAEAHVRDPTKGKVKLEQPEKYGGDRETLPRWITAMRNYIDHNSHQFITDESKTRYAATRLKDKALMWFSGTPDDFLKGAAHEPFTAKVFGDYSEFEAEIQEVFGDKEEKLHVQERLSKLRQTKSAMAYAAIFRQDSMRAEINEEGLKKMFYDGLKEDVKDELYQKDQPETLDGYIAMAIRIDERQYARKQQKKGAKTYHADGHKTNDKKKRQYKSTASGTHAGPMDVDAIQKAGKKDNAGDKSGITCYNCGKKGHFKHDCQSKKEWRPVPGKETATIDEVKKGVRFQEVAAASYTQDDLEIDIDQALE